MTVRGRVNTLGDGRRWLPVRNSTTETIPAFAVMRLTGLESKDGRTVFVVGKPNGSTVADVVLGDRSKVLINGPRPIPAGKWGDGTQEYPAQVAYESLGPLMGPEDDNWKLINNARGFIDLHSSQAEVGGGMPAGVLARWVNPAPRAVPVGVLIGGSGSCTADLLLGDGSGSFAWSGSASVQQNQALGTLTLTQDGFIVVSAGYYKLTWHATVWTEVATSEGARIQFAFAMDRTGNGGSVESVGICWRTQSINNDGAGQGYTTDPLITQEMVSMTAVAWGEAGDSFRIWNQSTDGGSSIEVYASGATFAAEMIRSAATED